MRRRVGNSLRQRRAACVALALIACVAVAGCRATQNALSVKPKTLRDVPAARLAFRFEPDVKDDDLPASLKKDDAEETLPGVKADFETRRGNTEALMRTVLSPTGQRALALYGTSETDTDFRIDLYGVGGNFVRNVLPHDLTGVFPSEVVWSRDGQALAFSGIRSPSAQASPTPAAAVVAPDALDPADAGPPPGDPSVVLTPTPVAPLIQSVQTFKTEQIYVGNSDGFDLRPITQREGLIYFKLAWSPDGQSIAALACREDEWEARKREGKAPAGRPRIVTLEGQERLLASPPSPPSGRRTGRRSRRPSTSTSPSTTPRAARRPARRSRSPKHCARPPLSTTRKSSRRTRASRAKRAATRAKRTRVARTKRARPSRGRRHRVRTSSSLTIRSSASNGSNPRRSSRRRLTSASSRTSPSPSSATNAGTSCASTRRRRCSNEAASRRALKSHPCHFAAKPPDFSSDRQGVPPK
ncbi:MAG: hypothetical protein LC802_16965 [Acidobacteria bacterium]|nr:hypothetical protein [Acidobacteriota bacterium]